VLQNLNLLDNENCIFETSQPINMSFGNLLFDLPPSARNLVRLIEKMNKKIINKKLALVFNQTCIKYIYIYILNMCIIKFISTQVVNGQRIRQSKFSESNNILQMALVDPNAVDK
jgi:hypothetical protein